MFLYTSGYSIDFPPQDTSIYFTSTDDATIHR